MTAPNVDIVDCHDIELLLDFWAAALGYRKSGIRQQRAAGGSIRPKLIVPLQIDLAIGVARVPVRPIGSPKPARVARRPGAGDRGRSCGAASAVYSDIAS